MELAVTQTPVKDLQLTRVWSTRRKWMYAGFSIRWLSTMKLGKTPPQRNVLGMTLNSN